MTIKGKGANEKRVFPHDTPVGGVVGWGVDPSVAMFA